MTIEQKQRLIDLRCQGKSYTQISQMLDLPKNTVASFCQRRGLSGKSEKHIILCKQCGKQVILKPKRKPRKFCSDACRTIWWNSHQDQVKRKAIYNFSCAQCGKQFTAYGNAGRKYCSHACYIANRFGGERDGSD